MITTIISNRYAINYLSFPHTNWRSLSKAKPETRQKVANSTDKTKKPAITITKQNSKVLKIQSNSFSSLRISGDRIASASQIYNVCNLSIHF